MTDTLSPSKAKANPLWGGHFDGGPAAIMAEINQSISFDKKLYRQDIQGSRAHCRMLVQQGIIPAADGEAIVAGLDKIEQEIDAGEFIFREALEDIHMNVEARLHEIIGEPAGKLHTARSRNDQVATDLRLWVRDMLDVLDARLQALRFRSNQDGQKWQRAVDEHERMIDALAETYPEIPLVMHQDHGNSEETCMSAIRHGFTSVMMDGSLETDMKTPASYDYNVAITERVARMAHWVGASVEGELGVLGSLETGMGVLSWLALSELERP